MRWIVRIVGVLLLLAAAAVVALFLIPTERIARIAAERFEAATGRRLEITGPVSPSLWPEFGVRAEGVRIANAPWAGDGPLAEIGRLSVGVAPMALLSGEVVLTRLELERPVIRLVRGGEGRWNFMFEGGADRERAAPSSGSTGGGAAGGAPALPAINLARVIDGRVIIEDLAAGTRREIALERVTLSMPDPAGRASLDGRVRINGQEGEVRLGLASPAALLGGRFADLELALDVGASRVEASGRAGIAPEAELDFDATLADRAIWRFLDMPPPELPEGLGRREIAARGKLVLAPGGSLHLRGATVRLDGSPLRIEADLDTGGTRPALTARVVGSRLALGGGAAAGGDGTGGNGADGGARASAGGWPETPIDLSALSMLDAEVDLALDALDLAGVQLAPARVRLALAGGRLAIVPRALGLYGGTVSGRVALDGARGAGLSLDLALDEVRTSPLLGALVDWDRLQAPMAAKLRLDGRGGSLRALVESLSGSVSVALGQGELLGFDLVGMIRNLDLDYRGPGKKTIFDSITADFAVAKGVMRTDNLAFRAPLAVADGRGAIDLPRRRLSMRLDPRLLPGAEGAGGVGVPVIIEGPFSDISVRPDMEAVIGKRLGIDAEGAREAVRRKIEEQKDRLEEQAKRALERAIGLPFSEGAETPAEGGAGAGQPSVATTPEPVPAPGTVTAPQTSSPPPAPPPATTAPVPASPEELLKDKAEDALKKLLFGN